ncbi:hypothetical protein C0J52_22323 [Blattella germanica]|nr:hypothetical protein C0J52_22323 [Blattella germanica]
MDIVNFDVKLTDLNKICRLCMGKDINLLPLFVKDDNLSEKIMNLSPRLKLHTDDGLPSQICSLCVNQVNTSYNFKLQCETSDITLRRLLDFKMQVKVMIMSNVW